MCVLHTVHQTSTDQFSKTLKHQKYQPTSRMSFPLEHSRGYDQERVEFTVGDDTYLNTYKPQRKLWLTWPKRVLGGIAEDINDLVVTHKKFTLLIAVFLFLSFFTLMPYVPHVFNGGDPKVVIILAANEGGGVFKWKGPQEWSVERSSIANKKQYAKRHGYGLTIKDMTLKKRYSHEWRELWEKVDLMKQAMRQFPNTEWFWWIDLHTYIMEPHKSLELHLLNKLDNVTYRNLETFNPIDLKVPLPYVDYTAPVDMVITQDCGGFNLGSFLMRRSEWSDMLLDIWWDPAMYEQMHMQWEHKEQDSLETLYETQPWIRERVGFVPLRAINAFPPGACADKADDPQYFYHRGDFLINMAGCEFGRDCWGEMEHYKALLRKLQKWWRIW